MFAIALIPSLTGAAPAKVVTSTSEPVVYGHHHLNVTSIDEHRKFWVDGLGGTDAKLEGLPTAIVKFPGVLVLLRQQPPKGGTSATVVPRIGFDVKSLAAATDRLKSAGYQAVTSGSSATVSGPDGIDVELVENIAATEPIAFRGLQFSVEDPEAVSAWYARMFGATVTPNRNPREAALSGLVMLFQKAADRPAGTQGRVLDHIGFEVVHLDTLCANLQAKGVTFARPYSKLPAANLAIAFLTDPWGTYIELTEGLNQVK